MKPETNVYDVIVIGGGASGMMAAGRAAALGKQVLLIEKNRVLGEKLRITGGGRCNILNMTTGVRALLANYGEGADFLFSPFSQFGVTDTYKFFEGRGLPLKIEANNRAFPKSEKASDVANTLIKYMKEGGVVVRAGSPVQKILKGGNKVTAVIAGGVTYSAKSFILATGGASHPETGSTGDGFGWLRDLGHTVKPPTPTIVPLTTTDKWSHFISGISLSALKITFFTNGKKSFSKIGSEKSRLLFTHAGLSGPLILNSAGEVADLLEEGKVTALIDVYHDKNIGELDAHIQKVFGDHKNKLLKNVLREIVPAGMAPGVALLLSEVDLETQVNSIKKESRRKIVDLLKSLPVNITGLMGYDKAVVADGGVSLDEIDTRTMRSKILDNLFITGDLLHINRPSGGFSLQLCWTTGWVAGLNA